MKVLQVGKFYPPQKGGMETVLYDLTEELNKKGVKTDVLCSNTVPKTRIEKIKNYKVVRAANLGMIASTSISPVMVKHFRKISNDYDIVHIHHPNPMANLALLLSGFKGRVLLHWHSDIIRQKHLLKLYRPLLLAMLNRANKIIASSPPYAEHSNILKMFRHKVRIIPFGLDTEKFKNVDMDMVRRIRERYQNKKMVFALGRLIYYKGFEYLIESAKYIPDDYVILIGGTGGLKEKLLSMIRKNGLENKVFLVGDIPSDLISSYFEACDLFVLPSIERSEAFGIVQLEAMYFKKPVISTNIIGSGVPWVNEDGVTGYLVEPQNAKQIAEAVLKILNDRNIYKEFSDNAYRRFLESFHINKAVEQIFKVYEDLMAHPVNI